MKENTARLTATTRKFDNAHSPAEQEKTQRFCSRLPSKNQRLSTPPLSAALPPRPQISCGTASGLTIICSPIAVRVALSLSLSLASYLQQNLGPAVPTWVANIDCLVHFHEQRTLRPTMASVLPLARLNMIGARCTLASACSAQR